MEKRRSKRITVDLTAERISGNEKYGVFIENISENGIHLLTTHTVQHTNFSAGKNIDLRLHISRKKTLTLLCKIKWSCLKTPPNGLTDSIGLEIIDPPLQYIEFVRALH